MITLSSKARRIWKAVEWSLNFNIQGGSLEQQHDADNDLFYPDRAVTPTLIEPVFRIIDKDKTASREATSELINVSWKYSENGGEKKGCVSPDYEVFADGTEDIRKGAIMVNRNIQYGTLVTLYFAAQYFDQVRKRTLKVEGSLLLNSRAVASLLLFTKLDKPNGVIIDPFSVEEEPLLPIKPVFQLGDEIVTDLSIIGGWWYKIEGGQEIAVNVSEHLEFESYDKSTYTLTVRRDFIRDTVLRFKSALFPDKQIPSSPPENCNRNDIRLIRKYPDGVSMESNQDGGSVVSGEATEVIGKVTATVSGRGVIANPDEYWTCDWWTKAATAGTDFVKAVRGFGPVRFPVPADNDLDIDVRIEERGPQAVWVENGKVVTYNGKAITNRKYS